VSCLNPNVFFEFGIRTSLNKPVCIVKGELTKTVPFDTSILNHKEYKSTLEPWHLEDEIAIISAHLTASAERSKGENSLWKFFGFKSEAEPYKVEAGTDGKLDYLTMQIDQLQKKIDDQSHNYRRPAPWQSDLLKRTVPGTAHHSAKSLAGDTMIGPTSDMTG
jgi:hypothetical protein